MCDLVTIEDDLNRTRDLVLAIFMAAGSLHRDEGGPIQAVANEALHRIMAARAAIARCRTMENVPLRHNLNLSVIT